MHLELIGTDPTSTGGSSAALYRTEGGWVLQGKKLDDQTRTQLRHLDDGEDAVFVPQAVIDLLPDS